MAEGPFWPKALVWPQALFWAEGSIWPQASLSTNPTTAVPKPFLFLLSPVGSSRERSGVHC